MALADTGPRRLLTDAAVLSLAAHTDRHGPVPSPRPGPWLADLVEAAGLRGRGGAGFPTATKLRAVAAGGRRTVVVANGAEGEPPSRKDVTLMTSAPHLVLDGATLAAGALDAARVIVRVVDPDAARALRHAVAERRAARCNRRDIEVVVSPESFLAGEETAAVRHLAGGPARPAGPNPRPFERGVDGRPTLVQNVETLANIALIARYGAEWYRNVGTSDEPGTVLSTVTAPGNLGPRVVEVPLGVPLGSVVEAAGGSAAPVAAYLVGGYHGAWLPASAYDVPFTHADLRAAGGALGAGVVAVLPAGACGLAETARVVEYLAGESSRQCGPCRNGLPAIADELRRLAIGAPASLDDIRRWAGLVTGRGACRHPDGTVRFLASALTVFADDVERHAAGQVCPTHPVVLPVPMRRVA